MLTYRLTISSSLTTFPVTLNFITAPRPHHMPLFYYILNSPINANIINTKTLNKFLFTHQSPPFKNFKIKTFERLKNF